MRPRLAVPAMAAAALLVVAALAAALSRFSLGAVDRPPAGSRAGDREELTTPAADEDHSELADAGWAWSALSILLTVLAVVIVVALLVAVLRGQRLRPTVRHRRRRLPGTRATATADRPPDEQDLVAAVDASLATLAHGSDPRAAVIACWVRLQDLAAAAGVDGRHADTADDLVWRLLRAHRVDEPALADLAEVYRWARYSPHLVDEQMSRHAREALERLRQALSGAHVKPGP
jgi:hypothetical protein